MNTIFGVEREGGGLVVVGSVLLDTNGIELRFTTETLARIGRELRPLIILAPSALSCWPNVPSDLSQRELETRVWADLLGKRADHRPRVWRGWPLSATLAILRPEVPCPGLEAYEPKQGGFLETTRGQDARRGPEEVSLRGQGGADGGGDRLSTVRRSVRCAPELEDEGAGEVLPVAARPKRRARSLDDL